MADLADRIAEPAIKIAHAIDRLVAARVEGRNVPSRLADLVDLLRSVLPATPGVAEEEADMAEARPMCARLASPPPEPAILPWPGALYRDFHVYTDDTPRGRRWMAQHRNYDGPTAPDDRHFEGESQAEVGQLVDDWHDEHETPAPEPPAGEPEPVAQAERPFRRDSDPQELEGAGWHAVNEWCEYLDNLFHEEAEAFDRMRVAAALSRSVREAVALLVQTYVRDGGNWIACVNPPSRKTATHPDTLALYEAWDKLIALDRASGEGGER